MSTLSSGMSKNGFTSVMVVPSMRAKLLRWARSQRANPSSIVAASAAKVWEREATKTRPGRGQNRSPRPETSSTVIESQMRAIVP